MTETAVRPTPAPSGQTSDTATQPQLRGKMGTFSLLMTALAINAPLAILAGYVPVVINAGNGLGAPIVFGILTLVILTFAVGLNAMSVRMTRPGGFYSYISLGLGRLPGLAGGFSSILLYVMLGSGTFALFGVMTANFVNNVLGIDFGNWLMWAIIGWAICLVLSLFNVELSSRILTIVMFCEIAIVVIWNLRVLTTGGAEGFAGTNPFPHLFDGSFGLALMFSALSIMGFESLQVFREETKDHQKTVPRATYIEIALIGVMYAVSAYSYIVGFSPLVALAESVDPTGSVLTSIAVYISQTFSDVVAVLLIGSTLAANLAIQNVSSRYFYSMARDGVLPRALGRVNAKHGSPMIAALVSSVVIVIAMLLPPMFGMNDVETYTFLGGVGAYCVVFIWAATSIAIIAYFRRVKDGKVTIWQSTIAPGLAGIGFLVMFVIATLNLSDLVGGGAVSTIITVASLAAFAGAGVIVGLRLRRRDPVRFARVGDQG
ncbi:APC family permease [Leucobacter musarum]|uniref:APC family permease n=1 Tax=Leucobacter musarum TaxID=1930747 RepID=UPI0006A7CFC4|nr:APC family permease [Leucobacter musarum]